ncbi:MAG: hypothetical protein ACI4YB_13010 [Oscillospiraceae bacterium]
MNEKEIFSLDISVKSDYNKYKEGIPIDGRSQILGVRITAELEAGAVISFCYCYFALAVLQRK